MKKRIIGIFLFTIMLVGTLTGCGNKDDGGAKKEALEGDLNSIVEKIYENKSVDLGLQNIDIDLNEKDIVNYNMGIEDTSKIKEALVSEAMISSQAYSMVIARVNDAKDAEAVANEMLNGIDQRKWICVEADDLKIVTYNDIVLLVMVSSSMEDIVTAQELVDAFGEVCQGEFDIVLSK